MQQGEGLINCSVLIWPRLNRFFFPHDNSQKHLYIYNAENNSLFSGEGECQVTFTL